jgi:chemotaxis protein MotB
MSEKANKNAPAAEPKPEIIFKKVSGGHGGGHGGAWKIALADMMTAMMAFFLLMWLLGATNKEQRKGLGEYFRAKTSLLTLSNVAGTAGVLTGKTIGEADGFPDPAVANNMMQPVVPVASTDSTDRNKAPEGVQSQTQQNDEGVGKSGNSDGTKAGGDSAQSGTGAKTKDSEGKSGTAKSGESEGQGKAESGDASGGDQPKAAPGEMTEEQKKAAAAAADQKAFEKIEKEIKATLEQNPDLKKIAGQMKFVRDKEGLRIEIIDQADFAMFAIGTTNFLPKAQEVMSDVAKSIKDLPNKIAIRGHTDGFAYSQADKMNNWRLSAQRADSTRRFLTGEGIDEKRFMKIEGVADREAYNADNPLDPRNRRISITVLAQ